MQKKYWNRLFTLFFVIGSLLLLAGSWYNLIPITLTEDLGFITGAATVWLTVVENVWNFPIGIANDIFFIALFLPAGLFADTALQVVYILLGVQGWYLWLRGGKNKSELKVSRVSWQELLVVAVITVLATYGLTLYLQSIQDTAPFWDALTTALSLAAQYLLNKKFLENWYIWISTDVIYIWLYAYKHLYLTGFLYLIFLIMCVFGVRSWLQSLRKEQQG